MDRINKIKKKFGVTCFRRWGETGGSPVLKAWKRGKLKYVK